MGLDTTHDCWHGAYSAFSRWREKIAKVAGFTFDSSRILQLDWGSVEAEIGHDLNGRWKKIPVRHNGEPEALLILLAHSDCEGKLQHEFLAAIADRLEALLPKLEGDGGGHVGSYRDATQKFIAGLRDAYSKGEDVEFH